MSASVIRLTKRQIGRVKERIQEGGIQTPELAEDLLDHFCVAIEAKMGEGEEFETAFDEVFNTLQEDELKTTEMKTQELLEGKEIFYPNLRQSFRLLLVMVGGTIVLTLLLFAIGQGSGELVRERVVNPYLPLLIVGGNLLVIGGAIGYAIRKIRHTQIYSPVFSFRAVPAYVYGLILPIALLSQFWLEPLVLFLGFPNELVAESMGNYSPLVFMLVMAVNVLLLELLFRGIILKGLLMTTTPLKAILWSSFLCALAGFTTFFFFFAISLMLGWLYWKTRSLYPSIVLFMSTTFLGYVASWILTPDERAGFTWWNYVDHNLVQYLPLVAGSLLLTAGLFFYLHQKLNSESAP